MSDTEKINWEKCLRLFIKTLMGNAIPISWLFYFQKILNVRWDEIGFWSAYAIASAFASLVMWYVNRTRPDPTYQSINEVPSPIFGAIVFTFQPAIFVMILVVYTSMK